ncbi:hypothetical protein Moror_11170 [Moniliophthora roreri MCA 2997]|uniref:Uncharacterized protein n=1 Tax=Moniliophthora roreri (strain MCA 2997) TaxID=1381753 RepID=V2W7A1_MONRO|nr:hypothetical protein Moror_11170 [Moniliophthora roreri MCA 2997]
MRRAVGWLHPTAPLPTFGVDFKSTYPEHRGGWWTDKRQQSEVNAVQTITTNTVGKQEDCGGKSPSLTPSLSSLQWNRLGFGTFFLGWEYER